MQCFEKSLDAKCYFYTNLTNQLDVYVNLARLMKRASLLDLEVLFDVKLIVSQNV